MKRLAILLTAVAVAGCSGTLINGISTVAGASVSAKAVFAIAQSFGAAEIAAANYLRLPRCAPATRPICREPGATPVIKGAARSGRIARDAMKRELRAACAVEFDAGVECEKSIPVANYNTLATAITTISDATAAYRAAVTRQ